jgi:hypothetical protein
MKDLDLRTAAWRKSSHSGANGGECVEVARGVTGVVPVRDSKHAAGPVLALPVSAWETFLTAVQVSDI